jgi:hypothetical protein
VWPGVQPPYALAIDRVDLVKVGRSERGRVDSEAEGDGAIRLQYQARTKLGCCPLSERGQLLQVAVGQRDVIAKVDDGYVTGALLYPAARARSIRPRGSG